LAGDRLYPDIDRPEKTSDLEGVDQIVLPVNPERGLGGARMKDLARQSEPLAVSDDPRQERWALQLALKQEYLGLIGGPNV
jgi:hypothetical protein